MISVADVAIRDQIRTAMKVFPGLRALDVPRERLLTILTESETPDAIILDLDRNLDHRQELLEQVRQANREVPVLVVGDLPSRQYFSRVKVELNVLSFIATPLDQFDLARRLHRLYLHLGKNP
jgi:two-component SAPR family response regulator